MTLVNEKRNTPCRINPLLFSLFSSLYYPSLSFFFFAVFYFGDLAHYPVAMHPPPLLPTRVEVVVNGDTPS